MFIYFLIYLGLCQQQDFEITELEIEKEYEFIGLVGQARGPQLQPVHFYSFHIEYVIPNEDVFVVLKALDSQSTFPSLYLSQVNQNPLLTDEQCGNSGLDVCVIEANKLIANTTYYLGVYCIQDCHYHLQIHYEQEEILQLGQAVIVTFHDQFESVVRIVLNGEDFDRVLIRGHFIQDKGVQFNETFHFYINEGNEIPSTTHYDYEAEEIWSLGKGVVLYETNRNGNLTVLLLGVPNTRLYFISLYYPKIREVGLFERVDDLVIENKVNFYKLIVQNEYITYLNDNSLSFDIHPFDGNPDVYIDGCINKTCDESYENYQWQSQLDQGYESMTISSHNRQQNGNSSVFIIAIKGQKQFSSYSFVAYLSNYFSRILSLYAYETGFLVKDEMAEYIVDVYNETEQTFTISATYPNGQGIIILKKCIKNKKEIKDVKNAYSYINNAGVDNFYNCSITDDQIKNLQIGSVIKSGTAELIVGDQSLQFYYNKSECETDVPMLKYEFMETNCEYVFAIYSYVDIMHYQIFIKGQEQHIELIESQQHRSFLMEYDSDLYIFNAIGDDIQEVVFQISVINGEYEAFSSRTEEKPNVQSYDQFANLELDILSYQFGQLNGTYYIRIYAKTLLRYTITTLVHYKNNDEIIYIPLKESIPHTHLNTKIEQITYFTFEINDKNPVFIHLNSLYGHFICQVINQKGIQFQPTDNQYELLSSEHTLIIEQPKQYFYISVKSLSLGLNESYEILYTTQQSLMEIFYGDPFYTYLDNLQQQYYYYQCNYLLEQIFVILSSNSDNNFNNHLNIYVSLKHKYPNQQNYEYYFNDGYITLQNITENQIIYIGIYSQGYNEFSLLIRGVQAITELQDDIIQQVPIPSFEQYHQSNLYYIVPKDFNGTLQIQAQTDFSEIEILCNVVDYNDVILQIKNQNHEIFPTENNYQLEEEISNSISNKLLLVEQKDLQKCQNYKFGCMILITVKLNQQSLYTYIFGEQYNNITTVDGIDGYFSIVISSSITTIRNGEMIIGYTGENIMSYYYFEVDEDVEFIQITVRPIDDGDPDIYVKKQLNDTLIFPTIDDNDFSSLHYKADFLLIQQQNNRGTYIIGIAGFFGECMFELILNYANIQLQYISEDQQISQHINQTVYYFYQHLHRESFRILIQGIQNIDVAINTYLEYGNNEEGLYDLLPYEGTDIIQFNYSHNNNLFGGVIQMINNDTNFCYYCTYIIALKPIKQTDMSILIAYYSLPLTIEYGQIYYDQCLSQCKYQLQKGDLTIILYSKQTNLQFYYNNELNFTMNITSTINIYLNESYLLVVNQSQFSLTLNDYIEATQLQLGKLFISNKVINDNNQNNISLFTFTPLTIEQWYTLIVNSKSEISIEMSYQSKQDQYNFKLLNPVQEWSVSKTQQELKYQLPDMDYQYIIKIQCNDTYNILFNLDGLKYIDANQHYIEQIQSIPQQYSLYALKGQELYIEKIDCLGKTELNFTNYQLHDSQDIFFNVTPFEQVSYTKLGISIKKNVYSIVPHVSYSHDQWYQINEDFDVKIDKNINITVTTMKRNKTGIMSPKLLIYQLHFSNQVQMLPAFGCQMDIESLKYYTNQQLSHSKQLQNVKEEDTTVTFSIQKPSQDIYGIVVFQVFYENHTIPYTYFYKPQLIFNSSIKEEQTNTEENTEEDLDMIQQLKENLTLIIGILGSLLFVGLLIVILLKYRAKKNKKTVNKQMDEEQEQVKSE